MPHPNNFVPPQLSPSEKLHSSTMQLIPTSNISNTHPKFESARQGQSTNFPDSSAKIRPIPTRPPLRSSAFQNLRFRAKARDWKYYQRGVSACNGQHTRSTLVPVRNSLPETPAYTALASFIPARLRTTGARLRTRMQEQVFGLARSHAKCTRSLTQRGFGKRIVRIRRHGLRGLHEHTCCLPAVSKNV
jgi:hypothetical protein